MLRSLRNVLNRRGRRREKGFSIVEVMFGVVIVAVSMSGTVSAIVTADALSEATTETRIAAREASEILETIRNTDITSVAALDGTTQSVVGLAGAGDGVATINVTSIDTGSTTHVLYQVDIVVAWTAASGQKEVTLTSYVANRLLGVSTASETEAEGEYTPPEDPPAEDPPAQDPPAEDPPAEDPPAQDPPVTGPESVPHPTQRPSNPGGVNKPCPCGSGAAWRDCTVNGGN